MHIYYINLAKSTDRNTNMINQLQKYNNKRIEAYDRDNYMEYIKINDHPYNKPNTNACIASHLLTIKTAFDEGARWIVLCDTNMGGVTTNME